ncbi:hypothetical protein B0H11DRAFT_1919938 [Mycena galericulata]|nr:hypothetical protein B0H11DRAFT_1919938 [Mycena galericulata]
MFDHSARTLVYTVRKVRTKWDDNGPTSDPKFGHEATVKRANSVNPREFLGLLLETLHTNHTKSDHLPMSSEILHILDSENKNDLVRWVAEYIQMCQHTLRQGPIGWREALAKAVASLHAPAKRKGKYSHGGRSEAKFGQILDPTQVGGRVRTKFWAQAVSKVRTNFSRGPKLVFDLRRDKPGSYSALLGTGQVPAQNFFVFSLIHANGLQWVPRTHQLDVLKFLKQRLEEICASTVDIGEESMQL